ncbi:MAG: hypothetical protein ABI792_06510 [bacterium]
MKTRNILLITSDKELSGIVKISALTLTKLNTQISIDEAEDNENALEKSKSELIDLIIFDGDTKNTDPIMLIHEIRKNVNSNNKKIIFIYSEFVNREAVFKAGCDSIMSREEFKRVINNILTI